MELKVLLKNEKHEILELCKPQEKVLFKDLTRSMFKDNEYILNKYFRNENNMNCAYANLLAFSKETTLYEVKKHLKKDFNKDISLAGYKYNPKHYIYEQQHVQDMFEEELFKEKDKEDELKDIEESRKARIEPLDFEAVESLYTVLFKAIKSRLVIILNLESIPGIINNAYDCYYKGVSCGASNAAMHAKIAEIRSLLENKETIEWLKTKPTDLMFDRFEYVDTYQRVLRTLTGIRDESLEYCRDLLENPEDVLIEDIIANDYPEFESYIENNYTEDEDDYLD